MSKLTRYQENRMYLIFITSLIATLGSLYYGYFGDPIAQIATGDFFNYDNGLTICNLCWYARILIYPITLLSGIALVRRDRNIAVYTLIMSGLCLLLETYHYGLQKFEIPTSELCTRSKPCNALSVNYFGFITIPLLCGIAALIIMVASIVIISKKHI